MGTNIQVLIVVCTIICFCSISDATLVEKNGTATFYKAPYIREYIYICLYIVGLGSRILKTHGQIVGLSPTFLFFILNFLSNAEVLLLFSIMCIARNPFLVGFDENSNGRS
jgi:hypothetical protein